MQPAEFVRLLYPIARRVEAETGISALAMLAQAALETGWLEIVVKDRYSGQPSNNLFNLKGQGPAGSVRALDSEFRGSVEQAVEHSFRAYPSFVASFDDYARLVLHPPRYQEAAAVRHDPLRFVEELKAAGYAHDPDYVAKIRSILERHIKPAVEQLEADGKAGPRLRRDEDYSQGTWYEPAGETPAAR